MSTIDIALLLANVVICYAKVQDLPDIHDAAMNIINDYVSDPQNHAADEAAAVADADKFLANVQVKGRA